MPIVSDDRRIGLNVQYITPDMKQLVNPHETALLVRGKDTYGHYEENQSATEDFAAEALARHAKLDRLRKETWDQATATQ